jgi:hypothetical protein
MVCDTSKIVGPFTDVQPQSLNQGKTISQAFNGDGGCSVHVTVHRV